ncbi:MAG: hypothetical protein ACRDC6_28070, partial [Shewanella sp.]
HHDRLNMVTALCSFLSCSRKRDLAALSKTSLSSIFSYSSNGGEKRGNQANTPITKSKLVTL